MTQRSSRPSAAASPGSGSPGDGAGPACGSAGSPCRSGGVGTAVGVAASVGLDLDGLRADPAFQGAADRHIANTDRALERQVFGAPAYVYDGELFWGQDRLDFLERALRT